MVTIGLMRKHLTELNKDLRNEFILKGVSKLSKEMVERHFKERFDRTVGRKDGFIYYSPKSTFSTERAPEEYRKLMTKPKAKPKAKAAEKPKAKPKKNTTLKKQ